MARISLCALGVASVVGLALVAGCSKDEPPPATPVATQQPYGQQPGATGYPQQGYPAQPGQPGYPAQPGAAGAPGQLATPGPTALACQNDSQCLTHKCNLQYQKCAFPCVSDTDCIQGSTCMTALGAAAACVPKAPGAP